MSVDLSASPIADPSAELRARLMAAAASFEANGCWLAYAVDLRSAARLIRRGEMLEIALVLLGLAAMFGGLVAGMWGRLAP